MVETPPDVAPSSLPFTVTEGGGGEFFAHFVNPEISRPGRAGWSLPEEGPARARRAG